MSVVEPYGQWGTSKHYGYNPNMAFSYPGRNVFWVSSVKGNNTNPGTRARPFATVDQAIGKCTANQGDLIVVMEKHSETYAATAGFTADVAGITILGLGNAKQRPNFLMDDADADVLITAADVTLQNLEFTAGFADVVVCINTSAAGTQLIDLNFDDAAALENFLTPIKATGGTNNDNSGLTVVGCTWRSIDSGCLEFIEIAKGLADLTVHGNFVQNAGTAVGGVLHVDGEVVVGLVFTWNFFDVRATATDVMYQNSMATNDGIAAYNYACHRDTAGEAILDVTGVAMTENYGTATATTSGYLVPAADTPNS